MIYVDTNVIMYAVGRAHLLRAEARTFFESAMAKERNDLCTSAEVLQELLHAYIPVGRHETLDAALTVADSCIPSVFPIDTEDVRAARLLANRHRQLGARDLIHLAVCRRHSVSEIKTFDRGLAAVFDR
ncbi:MAG: type II toxin-antitoxin system VapC family toxin [Deltaproteobacteria bacterium]|nr:type II toxin-antitoxin system VapC family toxin [Deltaproteobacteria bacterium]